MFLEPIYLSLNFSYLFSRTFAVFFSTLPIYRFFCQNSHALLGAAIVIDAIFLYSASSFHFLQFWAHFFNFCICNFFVLCVACFMPMNCLLSVLFMSFVPSARMIFPVFFPNFSTQMTSVDTQ